MTDQDYTKAIYDVLYLCSCAVNDTKPDQAAVLAMDLDAVYKVASRHMLKAAVGMMLQSCNVSNEHFNDAVARAQRKAIILGSDFKALTAELEKAQIWYMPLKGAVIKDIYPRFAMREMSDYDILFDADRAQDVKRIMEALGFETESFDVQNHDTYHKAPVTNFEMHRCLFRDEHGALLSEHYTDVKSRLIKDTDNGYGYHFTSEDFYIYMVAHEYKHYQGGGTGLRSLLDTYVYLNKNDLDMDYVAAETAKLGIEEFERTNRGLALVLFDKDAQPALISGDFALTSEQQSVLDYIADSGTYGTTEHKVENKMRSLGGGKFKYIMRRLFGPPKGAQDRAEFERWYPMFFKYPVLRPFLPIYRVFRAMIVHPGRISAEIRALKKKKE